MEEDKARYQNTIYYLQLRIKIDTYVLIPVLLYIVYITYIIHNSKGFLYTRRKVNKTTLSLKKKLTVTMSIYFIYQALFAIYMSDYLDDNDELLSLLIEFLKFSSAVMTPFVIIEQSKKIIPFYYTKIILLYWLLITLVILYEIFIEIRYAVYLSLLTLSSLGLVTSGSLTFIFYKYPRDEYAQNGNRLLAELQLLTMISEKTINQNKKEFKDLKFKVLRQKSEFNASDFNDKRNSDCTLTANPGLNIKNQICLDDINQSQPEKLPHYSKIEIKIKNDYKYLKHNSDISQTPHEKQQLHLNLNLNNSETISFMSNFYFQIIVKIKDKNINQVIKRSIKDFFVLDEYIKNEFDQKGYQKKLIDRLPRLKIPIKNCNNSLDFFKNYKINFEMYLKNILNEPSFITNDTLEFLNIYDHHMAFSYDIARKNFKTTDFYRIKDDILAVSRKKSSDTEISDDEDIRKSVSRLKKDLSLPLFFPRHSRDSSKLAHQMSYTASGANEYHSPKINKVSSNNIARLNQKIDILEFNRDTDGEYTISIRFSHAYMFKIMKKNLSDIMKMVNELFAINKNNENIKNLIKIYESKYFLHTQNFSLLLENVLQNSFDNLKLYKTNGIINEFFFDFAESNFVSRAESFLCENKNSSDDIIKEDAAFTQCKNLIEKYELVRIVASVPNFIVFSQNFKPNYFFILHVELEFGNGKREKIIKKYKYRELQQYIDFIKIRMNMNVNSNSNYDKVYRNIDDKIQRRMAEITKSLNIIFSNPNLLKFPEWLEIFKRDEKYKNLISNQKNNRNNLPKPASLVIRRRTESKESLFNINIRESIL